MEGLPYQSVTESSKTEDPYPLSQGVNDKEQSKQNTALGENSDTAGKEQNTVWQ